MWKGKDEGAECFDRVVGSAGEWSMSEGESRESARAPRLPRSG